MLIAFQLCRALLLQRLLALCAPDGRARTVLSPGHGALNALSLGCTERGEQIQPGTKQREQIHPAAQHGELPPGSPRWLSSFHLQQGREGFFGW